MSRIKSINYIALFLLIVLLILIRFFENDLFYDPYLDFFHNDYLYIDSPRREVFKVTIFTTLRYVLNSVVSLGVLYVFFKNTDFIKLSVLIYIASYLFLIIFYLYYVVNPDQEDYYLFFNIRRFLIQPIILIVLIPAFYFHKLKS